MMETQIGILTFKALAMTRGIFEQLGKITNCRELAYIGYVVDAKSLESEWFISKYEGKLYRTRRDYMLDNFVALGRKDVTYANFDEAIEAMKKSLPQIFLK
jgi:hypothetical protein